MRQTVLVILLVLIVVLSAHFAQVVRVNQRAERALHNSTITLPDADDGFECDDRAPAYDAAVAAAKE